MAGMDVPLRLLLCLGLTTLPSIAAMLPVDLRAAFFFASAELERACLGAVGLAVGGGSAGGGGLFLKKADGEGMVIVSAIWLTSLTPSAREGLQ